MSNNTEDFCPQCHKVVAPRDPERTNWGTTVIHRDCIRKLQERAALRNETATIVWRGKESRIVFTKR